MCWVQEEITRLEPMAIDAGLPDIRTIRGKFGTRHEAEEATLSTYMSLEYWGIDHARELLRYFQYGLCRPHEKTIANDGLLD